jgi:hypothetical protein
MLKLIPRKLRPGYIARIARGAGNPASRAIAA